MQKMILKPSSNLKKTDSMCLCLSVCLSVWGLSSLVMGEQSVSQT